MRRSSARSTAFHRNATSPVAKRSLRLESLEPRLVLSTGLLSQVAGVKAVNSGAALALDAVADAYVSSAATQTNYGASGDLLVQAGSGFRSATTTAYLKFDVSSVTGTMSKAVLNLTPLSTTSASSVTIRIQLLKDSADGWVEGAGGVVRKSSDGIAWANAPGGYGLTLTFSGSQLKAGSTISIDVTKLIQQSFNVNGIASFVVSMTSNGRSASAVDFASSENSNVTYRPTLTITPAGNAPTVAQQPTASNQTSTTVSLSVLGADAEDAESSLKYTWSATSPSGGTTPTFSVNGTNAAKNTTVTFSDAGTYVFTAKITDSSGLFVTTNTVTVTVNQRLTAISVTPSSVTLSLGKTQTFTVGGVDQFGDTMTLASSSITWSAGTGSFSGSTTGTTATYVAPNSETSTTVKVTCGSFSATAAVAVVKSNFLGLLDSTLASLTQSLDADGSISRADMIAILRSVQNESDGVVDATDMADLKTILSNSTTLGMANYVVVLAGDVVYGNTANTSYLGTTLGNLAVGSTAAKLGKLIDKWFYGTDLPTASYSYDTSTAGTLYGTTNVSHTDEVQGNLGDCYLLSALGSIADSSAAAIKNMIVDNGDGTWTVRFYSNGTADYVTVNSRLPVTSSGQLIYQGYGSSASSTSNELWLALIEKAYAQWNETGKTGRDTATNSYAAIEGGWMGDVYEQVLGYSATVYYQTTTSSTAKQTLINSIAAGEAVTIGTKSFNHDATTGLYGNHAYNVIGYSASTGKFTLYNPWGSNQPSQLTWSQLQSYCDGFAATVTGGSGSFAASASYSNSRSLITAPSIVAVPTTASTLDAASPKVVVSETSGESTTRSAGYPAAVDAVFGESGFFEANFQHRWATTLRLSSDWLMNNTFNKTLEQTATDWFAQIDFASEV
jgi:hypothetical protein